MSPTVVQEIMHKDKLALLNAKEEAVSKIRESDGKDWSFKAFHYLTAITILINAIDEQA
jgi:hypothetical protein